MSPPRSSRWTAGAVTVIAVLLVGAGLAPAGVAAQSDQPAWADSMYGNASQMVPTYNDQITRQDLGVAAGQLKGETVNLVVTDRASGETAVVSFRMTRQLNIRDLSKGPRDDATLKMTASRATVERISNSQSPGAAFRTAVKNDDIKISGLTLVNKVKWTAINAARGVMGLFG